MTGGSRTQSHDPERMRQKNWPVGPPRQRVTQRAREVKAADKRDPHVGVVFPSWAARMQLFHVPDTWKGPNTPFLSFISLSLFFIYIFLFHLSPNFILKFFGKFSSYLKYNLNMMSCFYL
jgi:hypothetical protein